MCHAIAARKGGGITGEIALRLHADDSASDTYLVMTVRRGYGQGAGDEDDSDVDHSGEDSDDGDDNDNEMI